jgi:ATP-dependent DNA ligase
MFMRFHNFRCFFVHLIIKDPNSLYIPGSRDSDWLKLKDFVTFDLAVLGFYDTPESKKAGKPFSAVLAGTFNPETGKYETLVKVGVGSVKEQEEIYGMTDELVRTNINYNRTVKANPMIITNPLMDKVKKKVPNRIAVFEEGHVPIIEVQCLDVTYSKNWHSCGLHYDDVKAHSLRIGSYKQLRTDKTRTRDVTTTQQIHDYFLGNV